MNPRIHGLRPWFLLLAVLVSLAGLALARPCAAGGEPEDREEREERSEPRLILPGGHVVQPGQRIVLAWSAADSISELEILLSVDGGRHYSVCVSPQLDPGSRRFVWRVPDVPNASLRLRIRYNRGGREIEGAPTATLRTTGGDADQPEPLALPPAPGSPGAPASRSGGAPASQAPGSPRPAVADDQDPPGVVRLSTHCHAPGPSGRTGGSLSVPYHGGSVTSVTFVPLRI
jgi:hypothetical protein